MILYGAKTDYFGQKVVENAACKKCGGTTSVMTNLYTQGHLFFIPFMPQIRKTLVICAQCKKRMSIKAYNKKYDLGMTKEQMKDIENELHQQIPEEDAKKMKRKNTVGTVFSIACGAIIVLGIIAALISG